MSEVIDVRSSLPPYQFQLLSEAIRHGECHKPTMELADYWLSEKQQVHKLFKVLAPRYQNFNIAYTRIHKVTAQYPDGRLPRTVLELRGNPFPPLTQDMSSNRNLIHNVLLAEAKKEFRAQKYSEMAEQLSAQDCVESSENPQNQPDSKTEYLESKLQNQEDSKSENLQKQLVSEKVETTTNDVPK